MWMCMCVDAHVRVVPDDSLLSRKPFIWYNNKNSLEGGRRGFRFSIGTLALSVKVSSHSFHHYFEYGSKEKYWQRIRAVEDLHSRYVGIRFNSWRNLLYYGLFTFLLFGEHHETVTYARGPRTFGSPSFTLGRELSEPMVLAYSQWDLSWGMHMRMFDNDNKEDELSSSFLPSWISNAII